MRTTTTAPSPSLLLLLPTLLFLTSYPPNNWYAQAYPQGAGSCAEGESKFPKNTQHANADEGDIVDSGFLKVTLGTVDLDVGVVRGDGETKFTPVGICTGENFKCQMCQGDCDDDDECEGDLVCVQRDLDEKVSGCYGMAVTERDYCTSVDFLPTAPDDNGGLPDDLGGGGGGADGVDTEEPTPAPTSETVKETPAPTAEEALLTPAPTAEIVGDTPAPTAEIIVDDAPLIEFEFLDDCEDVDGGCLECQGDCDEDDHCAPGFECYERDADEDVPGCTGIPDSRVDFCYDPAKDPDNRRRQRQLSQRQRQRQRRGLQDKNSPLLIQASREYTLTISSDIAANGGVPYKGFLVRVSGRDGQDLGSVLALDTGETDAQILLSDGAGALGIPGLSAAVCPEIVSGATHTINDDKTSVSVYLEIDAAKVADSGSVDLEVTVMIDKDEYYMTTYVLEVVDTTGDYTPDIVEPTSEPTLEPTAMPVVVPTVAVIGDGDGSEDTGDVPGDSVGGVVEPTEAPAPQPGGGTEFGPIGVCTGPDDGTGPLCLECEGDCDDDSECGEGLECYQRDGDDAVPGCNGDNAVTDKDYCYDPSNAQQQQPGGGTEFGPIGVCTGPDDGTGPLCLECEGDCDDDSECGEGLECYQRDDDDPVPGCNGDNAVTDKDYCYDPNNALPPPTSAPTPTAPLDDAPSGAHSPITAVSAAVFALGAGFFLA